MSKSLGNSPNPLDLMEEFTTDGVRTGILFSSPAGNDLLFDESLCLQGRNFANKIWSAYRLIQMWEIDETISPANETAIEWMHTALHTGITEMEDHYANFRISDALMSIYKLFWNTFCDWYLEMIKPEYGQGIDRHTYEQTIQLLDQLLRLLHPFMPFISEEIWQNIGERANGDSICIAAYPQAEAIANPEILAQADTIFEVVTQIRNIRNAKQISPKNALELQVKTDEKIIFEKFGSIIQKLANISEIRFVEEKAEQSAGFLVKNHEFFIPIAGEIDVEAELDRLTKDLEYQKGFLKSVEKKLSNERFVNNAPEAVVAKEKQKQMDAEVQIKALEESISSLKNGAK